MKIKGQITLFAVVGVCLLLAAFILFYFLSGSEPDLFDQARDDSRQRNSLQILVESCLQQSSEEGLEILRLQGGYIDIPHKVRTIQLENNIHISNKRIVKHKGLISVPYYIYDNEISVPSLELIETQYQEFINERVLECINDFRALKDQGYGVEYGKIDSKVVFDYNTLINLKFSVNVTRGENVLREEDFGTIIPIDFLDMYKKALQLTLNEYVNGYLERHAKRLISLYSFHGSSRPYDLPPLGLTLAGFSCERKTWSQEEAKTNLQKIFEANYPHLKIARLNYTKYVVDDPVRQGVYDSFVEDLLDKDLTTHLDLSYKSEWGMEEFNVLPSSGGLIEPDEALFDGIPLISMLCSLKYNFKYTFRNPILFTMWNSRTERYVRSSTIPGEKFEYRFFMEAFVCGNRARECGGKSPYAEEIQKILKEYTAFTSVCGNKQSGNIIITVKDNFNNPLEGVAVAYYCGHNLNDCSLGLTNSQGELSVKMPFCENGILTFSRSGYYSMQHIKSIRDIQNRRFSYVMVPERELNYNISLIGVRDFALAYEQTLGFTINTCDGRTPSEVFNSILKKSKVTDMITINLKNPKSFMSPTLTESAGVKMPSRVRLPPGNYEISSTYMGIVTIKPTFVDDGKGDKVEVSLNEKGKGNYIGPWVLGGSKYNWKVESKDMENMNFIDFFVLSNFLPGEDLNVDKIQESYVDETGLIDIRITIPQNSLPREGCRNNIVTKNVRIPLHRYEEFLRPRLK